MSKKYEGPSCMIVNLSLTGLLNVSRVSAGNMESIYYIEWD